MTIASKSAIAAALFALAACSAKPNSDEDAKTTATVTTAVAQATDVPETLTAYGSVEVSPSGEETLSAPVEAIVTAVRTAPGAAVTPGQILVVLKPSPGAQAELTKATADQDVADKALARAERLRLGGLDSDADVEQARAAATTARQARQSLAQRIGGAMVIRASHAGVVEGLGATPGDQVAAGAPLGKIGASGAVQMRFGVEPSDISRVKAGQTASVRAPGGADVGPGTVVSVQPRIDPQTRLAGVIVQARGASVVGQAVEADIVLRTVRAPAIPKAAIVYDQDQPAVFVVADGAAHKRPVTLGPVQGERVAVTGGLAAGERVVVEGAAALDDGMAVSDAGASLGPANPGAKE